MAQNSNSEYVDIMVGKLKEIRKHIGRPPLFETAEDLLDKFIEWFTLVTGIPYERNIVSKMGRSSKNGDKAETGKLSMQRAPTLYGFCVYAGICMQWSTFKQHCNRRADKEAFGTVIRAIEETIKDFQVQGAMSGEFSERLVARLNGIEDKSKIEVNQRQTTVSWEEYQAMLRGEKIE